MLACKVRPNRSLNLTRHGVRPLGHDHLQPTVAEILGLGMPLAAVADDGDGLAVEGFKVGVGVVVDRGGHGWLQEEDKRKTRGRKGQTMR